MAWEILLIYAVVLVAVASLPMILDLLLAYRAKHRMADLIHVMIQMIPQDDLVRREIPKFLHELEAPPAGVPGLARATMALSVVAVLGLATFHLLVFGTPAGDTQVINNVLSVLGGLLAAVAGFYFGGKAAEKKTETSSQVVERAH